MGRQTGQESGHSVVDLTHDDNANYVAGVTPGVPAKRPNPSEDVNSVLVAAEGSPAKKLDMKTTPSPHAILEVELTQVTLEEL
jgi:hypothetical protein